MKLHWQQYEIKHPDKFKLSKVATTSDLKEPDEKESKKILEQDTEKIADLQYKLYAENRQSLLIILQGMDASGKDSVVRHIMSGVNPQGVDVHSFKHPSTVELEHDYLWRHYQQLPEKGQITIFNRSHYENVLISKVHPELVLAERIPGIDTVDKVNKRFWEMRYEQINRFEKTIMQNGTHILKFYLHISKEEQRNRFLERLDNKEKHWKFSIDDLAERKCWPDYQDAYNAAIKNTSTKDAPWYVIPSDNKWYARLLISKVILETLRKMDPVMPPISKEDQKQMQLAKEKLEKE